MTAPVKPYGLGIRLGFAEGRPLYAFGTPAMTDETGGITVAGLSNAPSFPNTTLIQADYTDGLHWRAVTQPTQLTALINSSTTTIPVNSGAAIANGDSIQIDEEILLVTAGGGTTSLTATRAQNGSTAAGHANSSLVYLLDGNMRLDILPASTTQTGVITTTAQSIVGVKSFINTVNIGNPVAPGPVTALSSSGSAYSMFLYVSDGFTSLVPSASAVLSGVGDATAADIETFFRIRAFGGTGSRASYSIYDGYSNRDGIYYTNALGEEFIGGILVGTGSSSGGSGGGPISGLEIGTASDPSTGTLTLEDIHIEGGSGIGQTKLLAVGVALNNVGGGRSITSVTYNGDALTLRVSIEQSNEVIAYIFSLAVTSDVTGDIVITFGTSDSPAACAAVVVSGTSGILDNTSSGSASGTNPSVSPMPTAPGVYVMGIVATRGPLSDADGTWQNSFTDGQEDGTSEASPSDNVRICEGYKISTTADIAQAAKTGITDRPGAYVQASFK